MLGNHLSNPAQAQLINQGIPAFDIRICRNDRRGGFDNRRVWQSIACFRVFQRACYRTFREVWRALIDDVRRGSYRAFNQVISRALYSLGEI